MEYFLALLVALTAFLQGGFFPSVFLIGGITSSFITLICAKRKLLRPEITLCVFAGVYLLASLVNGYSSSSVAQACLPASCIGAWFLFLSLPMKKREKLLEILLWCSAAFAGIGLAALCDVVTISGAVTAHRLQFPFQYANAAGSWYAAMALLCLQDENKTSKYVQTPILTAMLLTRSIGALGMYGICTAIYLWKSKKDKKWPQIILQNALAAPFAAALFFLHGGAAIFVIVMAFVAGRYQKKLVAAGKQIKLHWFCLFGAVACVIPILLSSRISQATLTFAERICQIVDGARIIAAYPVLGIGAGNWQYVYPYYQSAEYVTTVVHSGIVQIGVDGGILAIATAIWLLYLLWKSGKRPLPITLAAILLVGHSLLDFTLEFYPICLLPLFLLSFGVQTSNEKQNSVVPRAVCAVVLLLCLTMCWGEQQYKQMVYSSQRGEWENVLLCYERDERFFGSSSEPIACAAGAAYRIGEHEKAGELSAKLVWLDSDGILLRSRCLYAADGEDAACEYLFSELARRDHQRYLFEAAREMLSAWNLSEKHKNEFNATVNAAVSKSTAFDNAFFGRTTIEGLT